MTREEAIKARDGACVCVATVRKQCFVCFIEAVLESREAQVATVRSTSGKKSTVALVDLSLVSDGPLQGG